MDETGDKVTRAVVERDVIRVGRNAMRVECYEDVDCRSGRCGGFGFHGFGEVWSEGGGEQRGDFRCLPFGGHAVRELAFEVLA